MSMLVAYTDGSYADGIGVYAVVVRAGQTVKQLEPDGNEVILVGQCSIFKQMANVSAELEAFYRAIEYAESTGASSITIYTDCEVITRIVDGTAMPRHPEMLKFMHMLQNSDVEVYARYVRGHSENQFNRLVDIMARRELRKLVKDRRDVYERIWEIKDS